MSLETPNRLAAALRMDVDVGVAPATFVITAEQNIAQVVPFLPAGLVGGANIIFRDKIASAGGAFVAVMGFMPGPAGFQFGKPVAATDPFFDIEEGDWTSNGPFSMTALPPTTIARVAMQFWAMQAAAI